MLVTWKHGFCSIPLFPVRNECHWPHFVEERVGYFIDTRSKEDRKKYMIWAPLPRVKLFIICIHLYYLTNKKAIRSEKLLPHIPIEKIKMETFSNRLCSVHTDIGHDTSWILAILSALWVTPGRSINDSCGPLGRMTRINMACHGEGSKEKDLSPRGLELKGCNHMSLQVCECHFLPSKKLLSWEMWMKTYLTKV